MEGIVFSVEEFSIYDGPGIRTSVFLKGCPLRCQWCHNPEGQRFEPEIVRSPNGCLGCGRCEAAARQEDGRTVYTEQSRLACPRGLLRWCGERMTEEALTGQLLKNETILKNGGGVTFSGGEPLAQSEFVFACIRRLRGRLHTAIQTCGHCPEETFETALSLADLFLYDLKLIDDGQHRRYTGVSNRQILANFRRLASSGVAFQPRIPLIPGVTDTVENLRGIAELLKEVGAKRVELLPYHVTAGGKYRMVGRVYAPEFDTAVPPEPRLEVFEAAGIQAAVL